MKLYVADNDDVFEPDIPSPSEFEDRMKELASHQSDDREFMHQDMDDLMCDILEAIGYGRGVEIFRQTPKWYA